MKRKYILGTRGSLLAVTQSTQIKEQFEALTGDEVELMTLKTQGDLITDKPLWQLEGKDFFTKELDQALLEGKVDFVVHSYKDLGSDRPAGIELAAITKRSFAHDILLIKKETLPRLKDMHKLVVGTSSPRRVANATHTLGSLLPRNAQGEILEVATKMLRGNVNTRIQRLVEGNYDAIILALPGLERLASSPESAEELGQLLKDLTFMVLPQSMMPSSASQGALALECKLGREDHGELHMKLAKLQDAVTVEEVKREREAFQSYGGGCHLAVGINVKKMGPYYLHIHRGEHDGKRITHELLEGLTHPHYQESEVFVGLPREKSQRGWVCDELINRIYVKTITDIKAHAFIAVSYAFANLEEMHPLSLWSAGTRTWIKLAKQGHWVNGSSDSKGEAEILSFKDSKAISMMLPPGDWVSLTHDKTPTDIGEVVKSYEREIVTPSADFEERLRQVRACYWMSYPQYESYLAKYPFLLTKDHYCGLGRTYQSFKTHNVDITPCSSVGQILAEGK